LTDEAISHEVKRFISEYINSVELLEVLLLIRSAAKKEWSVDSISGELRSSPESVSKRLTDLCARGLVSRRDMPVPIYRYDPKTKELDVAITGLAQAYAERRTRVIDLIFSKPIDTLRNFSDAFKLRKDDENG
jgi:DNA-binding HxlR family transcriptional regulator